MRIESQRLKKITYWSSVVIVGAILGVSLQFAKAWTSPAGIPPDNGAVSGPLTTSAVDQTKAGKLRSASTLNSDTGNTLVTKDYVDAAAGGHVRGGHYGSCYQEKRSDFSIGYGGLDSWPVTSCPSSGPDSGSRAICASGFTPIVLSQGQANQGANGVTSGGISKYNDLMDVYFVTWACAKL